MSNWHVGQQVVCIKRDKWSGESDPKLVKTIKFPRYNQVLTIRDMRLGRGSKRTHVFLMFKELDNKAASIAIMKNEMAFLCNFFKPLVSSGSMSSLTKYLDRPVLAPANEDTIEASQYRKKGLGRRVITIPQSKPKVARPI